MVELSQLQIHVSIQDLQDILGKSGRPSFIEAKSRFSKWFSRNPEATRDLVSTSLRAIENLYQAFSDEVTLSVSQDEVRSWSASTLSPYSSIYVFLTYLFLYACGSAMPSQQKERLYASLLADGTCDTRNVILEPILAVLCSNQTGKSDTDILKSAAQTLGRFGNWGCSTNLALLLSWRSRLN